MRSRGVCGPLTGGAFLAQAIATRHDLAFTWSERSGAATGYRTPCATSWPAGRWRSWTTSSTPRPPPAPTLEELRECGARTVALGALVTLGTGREAFAEREGLALQRLATLPNTLWEPSACPMCAAGEPLDHS